MRQRATDLASCVLTLFDLTDTVKIAVLASFIYKSLRTTIIRNRRLRVKREDNDKG
jgi:hypothetical protein